MFGYWIVSLNLMQHKYVFFLYFYQDNAVLMFPKRVLLINILIIFCG